MLRIVCHAVPPKNLVIITSAAWVRLSRRRMVAAIVLSDVPPYHWLQEQQLRHLPPTISVTNDEKAGVTACFCGADAWATCWTQSTGCCVNRTGYQRRMASTACNRRPSTVEACELSLRR